MTAPAATQGLHESVPGGQGRYQHFGYRPALDGLRGLAVAAVLLFHHGIGWAEGGYLGVSAFFTLSGFLITTLLLGEHERAGRLDLRRFWARRFRRLLPAALAGVLLALAFVVAVGDAATLERFQGDALATLGYVANWRFVFSELSYADLFAGESPLQHMWSLAIEEQFYLVLPLVAALAAARRDAPRRLAVLSLVGIVASIALNLVLGEGDRDRLYYGTDTRAVELFIGVFLACGYHQRRRTRPAGSTRTAAGAVALVAMIASWAAVEQSWAWLHPWGLLAHAVLAGVVILAVCDEGPLADALSVAPLAALGRISYGVYLYHWPLYLWLSEDRTGLDGAALLALRVAVTLGVATVSFVLLESPIRHQRVHWPVHGGAVIVGALAAGALLVVAVTTFVEREPVVDFAAAEDLADGLQSGEVPVTDDGPTTTTTAAPGLSPPRWEPPTTEQTRISIFGDSTALLFVPGLIAWNEVRPDVALWEGFAALGCGVTRGGERFFEFEWEPVPQHCHPEVAWPPVLGRSRPHIAIVEVGVWDLVDRKLEGEDTVRTIGDPVYDEFLADELRAANDVVAAGAQRVVWVLQPPPVRSTRGDDDPVFERNARYNELLVELFADHPQVGFVDVEGWLDAIGRTDDLDLRPDGTHFDDKPPASLVLGEWLGPAVMEAAATGEVIGAGDVEPVELGA